jgi:hypothetical protein
MPKKLKTKKAQVIFIRHIIDNAYHFFCNGENIGHLFLTRHPSLNYEAFTPKITKSKRVKDYKEGVIWLYKNHSGRTLKKPIILDAEGRPQN